MVWHSTPPCCTGGGGQLMPTLAFGLVFNQLIDRNALFQCHLGPRSCTGAYLFSSRVFVIPMPYSREVLV